MDTTHYLRFLNERQKELVGAVDTLLAVLADNDARSKPDAARKALAALDRLTDGLSDADRPTWTRRLRSALQRYDRQAQQSKAAYELLRAVIRDHKELSEQAWAATDMRTPDFEAVYRAYRDESRLPQLFDEFITKLEEIAASGEIDSIKVIRALEAIIATLKRNARSTYFATWGAWAFASRLVKNLLWEALSEIKVLEVPVRALRKTMDEIEAEMARVQQNTGDEIARLAAPELPWLVSGVEPRLLAAVQRGQDEDEPDAPEPASQEEAPAGLEATP